jgi:hypothetical protein
VKRDQIKVTKPNGQKTGKRIGLILCTGINALTATASTAPAASPRSLLPLGHFGTKIRSPKLFSTTNPYSNKPKKTKDIEKIVPTVMNTNDIIRIWIISLTHYHFVAFSLAGIYSLDFTIYTPLSVCLKIYEHYSCLLRSLK